MDTDTGTGEIKKWDPHLARYQPSLEEQPLSSYSGLYDVVANRVLTMNNCFTEHHFQTDKTTPFHCLQGASPPPQISQKKRAVEIAIVHFVLSNSLVTEVSLSQS